MQLLELAYNRLSVVVCDFSDADCFTVSYSICKRTSTGISIERNTSDMDVKKYPAVLLICGYGVIIKQVTEGDDIISKVMGETDNFIWNYSPDRSNICFTRKQQAQKVDEHLQISAINVFKTECCSTGQAMDDSFMETLMHSVYADTIKFRQIISPTLEGSVLASHIAKRIRIPILITLFILLLGNMFADRELGRKLSASRTELSAILNRHNQQANSDKTTAAIINELNQQLNLRYALICDCIGAVVPSGITLTQLSIQPVLKSVEQGKKPLLLDNTVIIAGVAHNAQEISSLVSVLQKLTFAKKVQLSSLGVERNSTLPQFKISMEL